MSVDFNLLLPSQAPVSLPPELWTTINELYTQLNVLVDKLNNRKDILQSPNGHYWKLQISNLGVITVTDLGTYLA